MEVQACSHSFALQSVTMDQSLTVGFVRSLRAGVLQSQPEIIVERKNMIRWFRQRDRICVTLLAKNQVYPTQRHFD